MGMAQFPVQAKEGQLTEGKFDQRMKSSKYGRDFLKIRDATKNENRIEHWDKLYQAKETKKEYKIEVKGKKGLRHSAKFDDLILLELHGVDFEGNEGWLYGSNADFIAFEVTEGFVGIKRLAIVDFVKEKIGIESSSDPKINQLKILSPTFRDSPHHGMEPQPYQIYYRYKNGYPGKDSFVYVPRKELEKIKSWRT